MSSSANPAGGGDDAAGHGRLGMHGGGGSRSADGNGTPAGVCWTLGRESESRKRKAQVVSTETDYSIGNEEDFNVSDEDSCRISKEIEDLRSQLALKKKELKCYQENKKLRVELALKMKVVECIRKENEQLKAQNKDLHENIIEILDSQIESKKRHLQQSESWRTRLELSNAWLEEEIKNLYEGNSEETCCLTSHQTCSNVSRAILEDEVHPAPAASPAGHIPWRPPPPQEAVATGAARSPSPAREQPCPRRLPSPPTSPLLASHARTNGEVGTHWCRQSGGPPGHSAAGAGPRLPHHSAATTTPSAPTPVHCPPPHRMAGDADLLQYSLLEKHYDDHHRARYISEARDPPLVPLRVRTHQPHSWDERYAPYMQRAGFLEIVRVYNSRLPTLDPALLTAAVDRWRPETHSFHMPCGEMTITLQDVKLILCLQLGGLPVTGVVDETDWQNLVEQFCGRRPPEDEEAKKSKRTSGVTSVWITENFGRPLPNDPTEEDLERYARVWLWHFLGAFLFPDSSGNTISWIFLRILSQRWEDIAAYSWGSAVLAWTYRQLCVACCRTSSGGNLGGCSYLLQVWCWERWPVGRPVRGQLPVWNHNDIGPTALYVWKNAKVVRGDLQRRYRQYADDLDVLTQHQVTWTPWARDELFGYISPRTEEEQDEWLVDGPLIFFHVVEMHYPVRVYRQFNRLQPCPPPLYTTYAALHKYERRNRYKEKNWATTHQKYVMDWHGRNRFLLEEVPMHDQDNFDRYLEWLHRTTRTHIQGPYKDKGIDEGENEYEDADAYDHATRMDTQLQRAPLQRYLAEQLTSLSNEAAQLLHESRGQRHGPPHVFLDKARRSCKKLAQKLSCVDTPWEVGNAQPDDEDEYEECDHEDVEDEEDYTQQDEIGFSQLYGAPFGTQYDEQGTSQFRRVPRQRDCTDIGFTPNMLSTNLKRPCRPKNRYTPRD